MEGWQTAIARQGLVADQKNIHEQSEKTNSSQNQVTYPLSTVINNITYDTDDPKVSAAISELNRVSAFTGPKQNGQVTPQTLFRASVTYVDETDPTGRSVRYVIPPGVTNGPYISQFLLLDIPYVTQFISPLIRTALPGNDFLIDFDEWLTVQNGGTSGKSIKYDYSFYVR